MYDPVTTGLLVVDRIFYHYGAKYYDRSVAAIASLLPASVPLFHWRNSMTIIAYTDNFVF